MKKIFASLLILAATTTAFAQTFSAKATLTLKSEGGKVSTLTVAESDDATLSEYISELNMEYRTMAKRIHRVMDECGFRKHITLHCARHTFAVLALTKGVPIESVSRILGHTNITTTQIYAKITMQKLDHDLTAFEQSLHLINNIGR